MRISENTEFDGRVGLEMGDVKWSDNFNIFISGSANTRLTITPNEAFMVCRSGNPTYVYRNIVINYSSHKATRNSRYLPAHYYATLSLSELDALDDFMYRNKYLTKIETPDKLEMAESLFKTFMEAHYKHLLEYIPTEIQAIERTIV